MYVIRGNAAVFKCHIPSFVSDHVLVVSWHDTEGGEYALNDIYGTLYCLRILYEPKSRFLPINIFSKINITIFYASSCISVLHGKFGRRKCVAGQCSDSKVSYPKLCD